MQEAILELAWPSNGQAQVLKTIKVAAPFGATSTKLVEGLQRCENEGAD